MRAIYLIMLIFASSCSKKEAPTSKIPVLEDPVIKKAEFIFQDLRLLDKSGRPIKSEPRIVQPVPPHSYPKSEYPEAPKVTAPKKTSKVDGYSPKEKPKAKSSKKPVKKKRLFDFFFKK